MHDALPPHDPDDRVRALPRVIPFVPAHSELSCGYPGQSCLTAPAQTYFPLLCLLNDSYQVLAPETMMLVLLVVSNAVYFSWIHGAIYQITATLGIRCFVIDTSKARQ